MARLPEYRDVVSLIPGGLIQFMDFGLNLDALKRTALFFREQRKDAPNAEDEAEPYDLYVMAQTADGTVLDRQSGEEGAYDYSFTARNVFEIFQGKWLPVPFLQVVSQRPDGTPRFAPGPADWARVYIAPTTEHPGLTHRVVLAFDTTIEDHDGSEPYPALWRDNVERGDQFRFANLERDNGWFLNAPWVDKWLKDLLDDHRRARRRGAGGDEEQRYCEHLAMYLTLLQALADANIFKILRLVPVANVAPIDVDLVLDFGNARTCGIMIESRPQTGTRLGDSYVLELRDLSRPELRYQEPFESRIEFARADFQSWRARQSGRPEAFVWPTIVRVGPEASRLAFDALGAEGSTGMSSPKRYLWDEAPQVHQWRFNGWSPDRGEREPPALAGRFVMTLNEAGTPLALLKDPQARKFRALMRQPAILATSARYTRSSLMMFVLSEIIYQAMVHMNSPAQRAERQPSDIPRRLRQVIMTLPPAMPLAEQKILRRWAKWAVRHTWEVLGWQSHIEDKTSTRIGRPPTDYRASPRVRVEWDEATCTQLVFLYNELTTKMQGDVRGLFQLYGRKRDGDARESLRIASIDVGGGTTDLIVNTFRAEGDEAILIKPHQDFREGFNKAGDDILVQLIELQVLPAIRDALKKAGVGDPKSLLSRLFGSDWINQPGRNRTLRRQFASQFAVPIALDLMHFYEEVDLKRQNPVYARRLGDVFAEAGAAAPSAQVIEFVENAAREAGGREFKLLDVEIRTTAEAVDNIIRRDIGQMLGQLCEIVSLYDCDLLLLTGRPSRLPAVFGSVQSKLPVPPDRIRAMHQFRVGGWYPFQDPSGCIRDPKTTVVVGAILCALSEGHVEGFFIDTASIRPRSTARYIGLMEQQNEIKASKVLFPAIDVVSKEEQERQATIAFLGPVSIGFRQLDAERWIATRFYRLDFGSGEARDAMRPNLPLKIELNYRYAQEEDEDAPKPDAERQRDEGEFEIVAIESKSGAPVPRSVIEMRLQTLKSDDGYWLDTGMFTIE